MNAVEPIRDKKQIKAFKMLLEAKASKYSMMFSLGINSGLRVSDILSLKVSDVKDKDHITIKEQKTGKIKRFLVNDALKHELMKYIAHNKLTAKDYLIQSRKGENKPISRIQAYRVLNNTGKILGLDEVGTHTMRKTFGYHHYQRFHDVAILQDIFNHSSPGITLRYIGISQDEKDKTMKDFYL